MMSALHIAPTRRRAGLAIWPLVSMLIGLGGCAGPGAIFEPLESPLFWPQPPAPARVHYVGQIATSEDLKAGKSLGEVLFGGARTKTMLTPYDVTTDRRGRLFVADSNGQVVHMFDLDRREYARWNVDIEGRRFSQPVGLLFDDRGRLLVADSVGGTIFVFDAEGRTVGEIGGEHLSRPTGLALDASRGHLYVADPGVHQLVVLDLEGRLITRVGERGIGLGQFNYPTKVAVSPDGLVYVTDSLNCRIQVFSTDLEPIRAIGERGDMPGYFASPKALAFDSDGHLYVVDAQFEAVQIFSADGALLLAIGGEGTGPGEFWLPAGIHIDRNDRIWVADSYNRRVQVFEYRPETEP